MKPSCPSIDDFEFGEENKSFRSLKEGVYYAKLTESIVSEWGDNDKYILELFESDMKTSLGTFWAPSTFMKIARQSKTDVNNPFWIGYKGLKQSKGDREYFHYRLMSLSASTMDK